jgi:ligand-binding sensor domain-containing protein
MKIKHLALSFIAIWQIASAGIGDWTTFISQNDVRDIVIVDGNIWCATSGGVFRYDPAAGVYDQYHNTNGLSSLDAKTIAVDRAGNIWVGFATGWINILNPQTNRWRLLQDYVGYKIYDLEFKGDSLLVALDIGISLYDIKRNEVKETYKHLGWQFSANIPVLTIMIQGQDIWAGTGSGIARSSFDRANLMAPESWINYTLTDGLPSATVNAIVAHGDSIYAGTNDGVAVLRNQKWYSVSSFLPDSNVKRLLSKNNTLYALTIGYVSRWSAEEYRWRNVAPFLRPLTCLAVNETGELWVGREKSGEGKGIAHILPPDTAWKVLIPPGPPSNNFSDLAVDQKGILWCASSTDGIFRFDGQNWRQFTTADGLINNGLISVMVDSRNRKWFGSTGGGLVLLDQNEKITVFYKDVLAPEPNDPTWVVVTDVKEDRYHNIWVLNSFASNSKVVAVLSAQGEWYYFAVQEGILSDVVNALDIDENDRVWIGTKNGVTVIDYNNTLANKSDDVIEGNNLTTVDGLENNSIKELAIDLDGIVWIATEGGLNYWNRGTVAYQFGLLSNSVNSIEVDVRNNKWFGTAAGVSVLAADGYSWTHYSTDTHPLVSDNVTSFGFDLETGKVYIGTTNGLSLLETPFSMPRKDLSLVQAGPNPFLPQSGQKFAISNLADDVAIKIMTENGLVVRQISNEEILGAYATWDGKNDHGADVASGIYIYVIYNEETGMNRLGKVAVIR